jgi:hypothetical protein
MKAFVSALIIAELLTGCRTQSAPDFVPDPRRWFVQSYDNGVITVQHEGYTYQARCTTSRSFNNASSLFDRNNVVFFPTCDSAIGLVGHTVQPFEGKQKDAGGWRVNMFDVGSTLCLQRWHDERTPWRQDEFTITSVMPIGNPHPR